MKKYLIIAMLLAVSAPAARAADSKAPDCVGDNTKENKALELLEAKGLTAPERTPADEKEFKAMDLRLKANEKKLAKDGLPPAECAALGKDLAKERALVEKLTAGYFKSKPSPVAACVAENLKEQKALVSRLAKAKTDGAAKGHPVDAAQSKAMEARLADIEKRLAKSGMTLADCAAIGKDIADATKALDKLTGG